jgi:transposase
MKESVTHKSVSPKKYAPEFKQEAVQLWCSSGKPAAVIAKELGIPLERLYHWKKDFAPPPGGEGGGAKSREQLLAEIDALRHEVAYVSQQRDILKKTLGILSEPPKNVINGLKR